MNLEQVTLARHALGLDRNHATSYRNYFVCGAGHQDYDAWKQMVADGDAVRFDGAKLHFAGDDLFKLTRKGAEAVLRQGESLDSEDFPSVLQPTT